MSHHAIIYTLVLLALPSVCFSDDTLEDEPLPPIWVRPVKKVSAKRLKTLEAGVRERLKVLNAEGTVKRSRSEARTAHGPRKALGRRRLSQRAPASVSR